MGNQGSRQITYEQYYESLKKSDPNFAQNLNTTNMGLNPYDVLGVRKNFEFEELKESYRRVAKLVHPDKGGSDHLFQMVTECFRTLAHEYKMRTSDRPHHELKREAQQYYDRNPAMNQPPAHVSGRMPRATDENFMDRFNRAFDENKLEDDNDIGYGSMMAPSSKNRDDIDIPRIFRKFEANTFNKTFDKMTVDASKEVVVYREPEALPLAKKMQYTELGGDRPDDFSSTAEGTERRNLQYTDFKKAHTTTRLFDPRAVQQRKDYKNIEQYEAARAQTLKAPETQEEIAWRLQKERAQEEAEQRRLARLQERDKMAALHHDKVNRAMLGMMK
jgi:curved DNA-binding protein CbpA